MIKRLLFLFVLLFLTACVSKIPPTFVSGEPLNHWQFNGKFAIKTPDQRQGLKINWHQTGQQFDISLYTVFGITVLKINGNQQLVTIEANDGPITGNSAEQLIWQLTQWHVPVNNLQHWLIGHVDDASNIEVDSAGHFISGEISDRFGRLWQLSLGKYQEIQGRMMPHSLRLQHGKLFLKLAINQWQLQKSP